VSEEKEEKRDARTTVEKHALSILMAILLGLLAWGGNKLDKQTDMLGRLDERFAAMKSTMESLGRRITRMEDRRPRYEAPEPPSDEDTFRRGGR
jgi:type II secretory pathway component PulJ